MSRRPNLVLLQGGCTPQAPGRPVQLARRTRPISPPPAPVKVASFVHIDSRPGFSYVESDGEILPITQFLDAAGQAFALRRRADVDRIVRVYAGKGDRWVSVDIVSREIQTQ